MSSTTRGRTKPQRSRCRHRGPGPADPTSILTIAERVMISIALAMAPNVSTAARLLNVRVKELTEFLESNGFAVSPGGRRRLPELDPIEIDIVGEWLAGMICEECGCSEHRACLDHLGNACSWIRPGLCSHCHDAK